MNAINRPFFFILTLISVVSLACGGGGQGDTPTQPSQPTPVQSGDGSVSDLDEVKNATVQIVSTGTFVDPEIGLQVNAGGSGTGFIIDPSGIAVTNNHVVAGSALLQVSVGGDSTKRNARVLGYSECSDLAVIDIEGDGYPYLDWYNGSAKVGLEVYAAGFPLGDPEFNLTKGIISKENADGETSWASVDHVLGHDATINPGNSGGPLVDQSGKVVGINYSSLAAADQYFAIGGDIAIPIIEQLRDGTDVDSIGVNGQAVSNEDGSLTGVWVTSVTSGSPADKSGLQPGDIIYQLEGLVLATDGTLKDYCDVIRSHGASDTMSMTVIRFGTGELLEGQLNGKNLEVTGSFDTGGGQSSGGGQTSGGDAPAYFTQNFPDDVDLSNYSYFEYSGNETGFSTYVENNAFVFDITGANLYVYITYDAYTYADIILEAVATNRGKNNNNVSLICRYDADNGTWYEFNIANNGLYWIYAHDGSSGYREIYSGGSNAIKQGKDTNKYTVGCLGDTLALYINDVEARTVTDTKYKFREGQVGFSVSSFDVTPILVEFSSFSVIEP
ncbi:MAG: trypsin-like peptidase domain-containing protein [Anaerolineales bacterium]|nr:trypsin-like peptidase domain-containing protein [Anaerolineales bacterium]